MSNSINLILLLYFLSQISTLDVKLNIQEVNNTINQTILNSTKTNQPIELFNAKKLFTTSSCQCNAISDLFYVSPSTNLINFTINTTNNDSSLLLENPTLYINSQKISSEYSLEKVDNQFFKLQINTICKNPDFSLNKTPKKKGIYKIESYSSSNEEYNNNDMFAILNFTFSYNKTEYHFSFMKFCFFDEKWKSVFSAGITFLVAVVYVYLSTAIELNFKSVKEAQKSTNVKWYHILIYGLLASCMLLIIYFFKRYIILIFNLLMAYEVFICGFYTVLFFIRKIGRKTLSPLTHKKLRKFRSENNYLNKIKSYCRINTYDIISIILNLILVIFYYATKSWLLNDILCFFLSFTFLSLLILKSFMLCFLLLFVFFIYDTFWVFYSDRIFSENVMVKAATSLNIPIKIEMPIIFSQNPIKDCMLLGMGDIVLPGVIIKYCHRFDSMKKKIDKNYRGGFYLFNIVLYVVSVILAMLMMFVFNHSQPVLFYISPIFIIGLAGKAIHDGCFIDFWNGLKVFKVKSKKSLDDTNNIRDGLNNIKDDNEKKDEDEDDEEEEEEEEETNKNERNRQETELQKIKD